MPESVFLSVLIVDGDEGTRSVLNDLLDHNKRVNGITPDVDNTEDALRVFEQRGVNSVMVDIFSVGVDKGIAFIDYLDRQNVPVGLYSNKRYLEQIPGVSEEWRERFSYYYKIEKDQRRHDLRKAVDGALSNFQRWIRTEQEKQRRGSRESADSPDANNSVGAVTKTVLRRNKWLVAENGPYSEAIPGRVADLESRKHSYDIWVFVDKVQYFVAGEKVSLTQQQKALMRLILFETGPKLLIRNKDAAVIARRPQSERQMTKIYSELAQVLGGRWSRSWKLGRSDGRILVPTSVDPPFTYCWIEAETVGN